MGPRVRAGVCCALVSLAACRAEPVVVATPVEGEAPLSVSFRVAPPPPGATLLWRFGDGATAASPDALHVYENPGIYRVSVTVTDPGGVSVSSSPETVVVTGEHEVATRWPAASSPVSRWESEGQPWRCRVSPACLEQVATAEGESVRDRWVSFTQWAVAPDDVTTCVCDYLLMPRLARSRVRDVRNVELEIAVAFAHPYLVPALGGPMEPRVLAEAIVDALGIGFLVKDLEQRPLSATVIAREDDGKMRRSTVLLSDPLVGTWPAVLVAPSGPGPHPAVLALPGHGDTPEVFLERYGGREYPARGYALMVQASRGMGMDEPESVVARALLQRGFTLQGLRVYEALVALKYLRHLPEIDGKRLALVGHSGGSATGTLVIRLEPGLRAFVGDWTVAFNGTQFIHCETVPALVPYRNLLHDFSTSRVPVLKVPYEYTSGQGPVLQFLGARM